MHALFGVKHIILIVLSLILVAVGYIFSRRLRFAAMAKIMMGIGLISETIKIFYYIIINEEKYGGILPKSDLPFHLCSIQIIFIVLLNISESEKLREMLVSFMMPSCLIGGLAALLIATDSARNGLWIITAQYFIYHASIMVFALYLMSSKEYSPTLKRYTYCLKLLLAIMFFAFYINSWVYDGVSNINFMYVAGPPQDGLPYLNDNNGWLSYIIRYAILVIGAVTLFYIKPIVIAIRSRLSKIKAKPVPKAEEAEEIKSEENEYINN